jgi:hypothetical protein
MRDADGNVHENMRDEDADDDAVRSPEVMAFEADVAHQRGIEEDQNEQGKLFCHILHRAREIFPGEVKIDEASDDETEEINDQLIVVEVVVDETDVQEDQDHVDRAHQADRGFLAGIQRAQGHDAVIEKGIQEDRQEDEDHQQDVLVFIPEHAVSRIDEKAVDQIIGSQEKQDGSAGENKLIEAFKELHCFTGHGMPPSQIPVAEPPRIEKKQRENDDQSSEGNDQEQCCILQIQIVLYIRKIQLLHDRPPSKLFFCILLHKVALQKKTAVIRERIYIIHKTDISFYQFDSPLYFRVFFGIDQCS